MTKNKDLPVTEDLDFSYLLGLMRPLHSIDEYAWLPELFAIIGHESLIDLCRYCGGEIIRIPTLEELNHSIDSLQYFYDVFIQHKIELEDVPITNLDSVLKIADIYDARNS